MTGADALELLARAGLLHGAAIENHLIVESTILFEVIRRYRTAFLHAA